MDDVKLLHLTNIRVHRRYGGDEESISASHPAWEEESEESKRADSEARSHSSAVFPLIKSKHKSEKGDIRENAAKYWKPIRKYDWSSQRASHAAGHDIVVNSRDDSSLGMSLDTHPTRMRKKVHILHPLEQLKHHKGADNLKYLFEQNVNSNHHNLLMRHLNMVQRAEHVIHRMPLAYLIAKPELRNYAIEKACNILIKPGFIKIHNDMRHAFHKWMIYDPDVQCKGDLNEKQFCFMIIIKVFSNALERKINDKFQSWARLHCTRYNPERLRKYHNAARKLQGWIRRNRQRVRQPYKNLLEAVQKCLHWRKAIKFTVEFERARRRAYRKMRKGIANRRRVYFAARIIQRIFRWVRLLRYIKWRNTRMRAARRLQRWRRKWVKRRSKKDKLLIHLGLRSGSYSVVSSKIPEKLKSFGILLGMEQCISRLQRWYFTVCGRLDLYMKLAARRAKMELEMKMNSNATIIQESYRAHLWRILMYAAVVNNRARRIQRGFRAYQYRKWNYFRLANSKFVKQKRLARMLENALAMNALYERFEERREILQRRKRLERYSTIRIQHCYRSYVIWATYLKEKLRKFYAEQRLQREAVLKAVRTIQRLYRVYYRPYLQSYHLKLCGIRSVRDDMYLFYRCAFAIQKIAMIYILVQRQKLADKRTAAVNKIWYFAKSFLLRLVIHYRIIATRIKRNNAATKIKRNYRVIAWLRVIRERFLVMRQRIIYDRMLHRNVRTIQRMVKRKLGEYYMPLRVAGRVQLAKRRKREAEEAEHRRRCLAAERIVRRFIEHRKWCHFLNVAEAIRRDLHRHRCAKIVQKFFRMALFQCRFLNSVERKRKDKEAERLRMWQKNAVNFIQKAWTRSRENISLQARFLLRRQMLDEYKRLAQERAKAEAEKAKAIADMNDTEDNLQATIAAAWKQGSDPTGANYYYNYVTGESSWEPPPNWVMNEADNWVRNVDDRGNVYYYNQKSGESRWLPPCLVCGKESERWCSECNGAYCLLDHIGLHEEKATDGTPNDRFVPEYVAHKWTACELEREVLKKGQVYCVECKKRACTKVCIQCWDYYCTQCFGYVHHVGALKRHKNIPYSKAKRGWMCVKAREEGELDYYVNGLTGERTFEKPEDLMTPEEKAILNNFKAHKEAAEQYVKRIDELQHDVEALKYERALAIMNGRPTAIAANRDKSKPKVDKDAVDLKKMATGGFLSSLFGGGTEQAQYRSKLMAPDERKRGKNRSDYIKGILEKVKPIEDD